MRTIALMQWVCRIDERLNPLFSWSIGVGLPLLFLFVIFSSPPLELDRADNTAGFLTSGTTVNKVQLDAVKLESTDQRSEKVDPFSVQNSGDTNSVRSVSEIGSTLPPRDMTVFLKMDVQKVIDEIAMRLEHENEWFRYKFLFVGGLIFAFLVHLIGRWDKGSVLPTRSNTPIEDRLNTILKSNASLTILAVCLTVSIAIDVHMRVGVTATNQAGIFLREYSQWEEFLRSPKPDSFHTDWWYVFFYWPHLHFITLLMFAVYLIGLRRVSGDRLQNWNRGQVLVSYLLVHSSIILFACSAHIAPSKFRYSQLLPVWPRLEDIEPGYAVLFYAGLALAICTLNAPCLIRTWLGPPNEGCTASNGESESTEAAG